jgi:hypothetical protein
MVNSFDGNNPWATENSRMPHIYEDALNAGDDEPDETNPIKQVSFQNNPFWIHQTLHYSSQMVKPRISISLAQRIVAKLGIIILRDRFGTEIELIDSLYKQIWNAGDHMFLKRGRRENEFKLKEIYNDDPRGKCSLRMWTAGAITEVLVNPLDFSLSTATLLSLIAGISTSTSWVPAGWKQAANRELQHFQEYIEWEKARVKKEMSK